MQIAFDDGNVVRELDVRLGRSDITAGELLEVLAPGAGAAAIGLRIGDRIVPLDHGLDEAGLRDGAVVSIATEHGQWPVEPAEVPVVELHVVAGLEAGRRFPLLPGVHVLGRGAMADPRVKARSVSSAHAEIHVDRAGRVTVVDLQSGRGTWVDGAAVAAGGAALLPGSRLRVGALDLAPRAAAPSDRATLTQPRSDQRPAGTIPFNRVPRQALPARSAAVPSPEGPARRGAAAPLLGIATLTPVLLAVGMVAVTRDLRFGMMALLSPVAAVMGGIDRRRQGGRAARADAARFEAEMRTFVDRLAELIDAERTRLDRRAPDPGEVVRRALVPSTHLWERVKGQPGFDDFLALRVGVGELGWDPPVHRAHQESAAVDDAVRSAARLPDAPVIADLDGGGVIGLVGDREAALAVARSLVCQACVHHGPADLPLAVCTSPSGVAEWDWTKWLPHVQDLRSGRRRLAGSAAAAADLLAGCIRAAPDGDGSPTLLVVLDDEQLTEGRNAPARIVLRGGAGPVAGIVLASAADRLPAMCTAVLTLHGPDGLATFERLGEGVRVGDVLAAGMDAATSREVARALAGFEDPELDPTQQSLPDQVRLLPLLDLNGPTAEAVAARWARCDPSRPATPIGISAEGVFVVDLVDDGPHVLVAGTTGAGKSELLRSLVVGLAASVDPDHLTFVLVDFKGGSAFEECRHLPHTVGLVTDLDPYLAERALRCLEAELRHRERVLRDAGTNDLDAYLATGAPCGPLPRLFVVVDEFATLKAELPDFVDSLVGVAQRGRSLGVHLLLATQRPSGAVSEHIRANTNLRVALRVQDRGDSNDVLGVGDAAAIPRNRPGRACARLGPGEVITLQAALSSAKGTSGDVAAIDLALFTFGPQPRPPAPAPPGGDGGRSELAILVGLIGDAFAASGCQPPRRPWPEPLPARIHLDELLTSPAPCTSLPNGIALAVADDPDEQRQVVWGWRPREGNLLLYGNIGSGTTTTLATVALALATTTTADRCHLYVLDLGAGGLVPLAALAHCGAVVRAGERERQIRLVRLLLEELDRRRRAAGDGSGPALVLLLDGYGALAGEHRDVAGIALLEDLHRLLADGPAVGIHAVVTADRLGAVPSAVAALVGQKLLFRLADRGDYTAAGLGPRQVPDLPPGRCVIAGTGQIAQVGTARGSLAEAVAAVAARTTAPRDRPAAVAVLPDHVEAAAVVEATSLHARPWTIAIGLAERDLAPVALTVHAGEHAVVAGGARTGKSSTLAAIATSMRHADPELVVVGVAGARSPLTSLAPVTAACSPAHLADALDLVEGTPGRALLLIDDADGVEDVDGRLAALVAGGPTHLLVVAAGRPDALRGRYDHWTRVARRHRLGVLLQPAPELDGELLGVHLPRRPPVAMVPGRGYVVNGGEVGLAQVAHV